MKTQFALNVRFSITRDGEKEQMYHYFRQREPVVFNRKNMTTVSEVLRQTIDEFKGENHKQMKAPFVVYAYFESLIKKIHGCAKKKTGNAQKRGPRVLWVFVHHREK